MRRFPINSILFLLLCFTHTATATQSIEVVSSIRPVHSLVQAIMQGVAMPTLLLDGSQSPHHTSLRPSDIRKLANADLVFWIGPSMETTLPRVLQNLSADIRQVSLLDNPHLKLLLRRSSDSHAAHEHGHDDNTDPHIWLNTTNVDLMLDQIASVLSELDPAHATQYTRNSKLMHQSIDKLRKQIRQILNTPHKNYISYHDAYQYFEKEFGLTNAGIVSTTENLQAGARHLHELRQLITQQNITCLVYDAPRRPPVIDTLLSGTTARAVELDALGLRQTGRSNGWFDSMRKLAEDFESCLSARR